MENFENVSCERVDDPCQRVIPTFPAFMTLVRINSLVSCGTVVSAVRKNRPFPPKYSSVIRMIAFR